MAEMSRRSNTPGLEARASEMHNQSPCDGHLRLRAEEIHIATRVLYGQSRNTLGTNPHDHFHRGLYKGAHSNRCCSRLSVQSINHAPNPRLAQPRPFRPDSLGRRVIVTASTVAPPPPPFRNIPLAISTCPGDPHPILKPVFHRPHTPHRSALALTSSSIPTETDLQDPPPDYAKDTSSFATPARSLHLFRIALNTAARDFASLMHAHVV